MSTAAGSGQANDAAAAAADGESEPVRLARGTVQGYETQLSELAEARTRLAVREAKIAQDTEALATAHGNLDAEQAALEAALAAAVDQLATLEG